MQWLKLLNKYFDNINIRTKFIISFVIAVLVPVIILGIYFINKLTQLTIDYTVHNFNMETDRLERNVTEVLETAKDIADRFYIDEKLQGILIKNFTSLLEMTETLKSYTEFDYYTQIHSEIAAVRIYTTNSTIQENWRFMRITAEVESSLWYSKAVNGRGKASWSFHHDNQTGRTLLRLSRTMPLIEGKPISVLTVDINTSAITRLLEEEVFISLLLLDISYSEYPQYITAGGNGLGTSGLQVKNFLINGYELATRDNNFIKVNNHEYYRIIRKMDYADFLSAYFLISFFPVSRLKENQENMFFLGLILILICLMVSTILILIFTHYGLIKRIHFLHTEMEKIVAGDLGISLKLEGQDEIGRLSQDIDKMIQDLKALISKVYEADLQKKEFEIEQKNMQFKLLASQVNPHFFFNSLEMIRAKALSHRIDDLNKIVKGLGKIMRRSLDIQHNLVTIESEIEFIRHYLGIQKYRYEDKLLYAINIDQGIYRERIIPHLLQPIVENAIVHGMENKIEVCTININSIIENAKLIISIRDDGVGIEKKELERIKQSLLSYEKTDDGSHGIGLFNVHQRIKLYYGETYGIHIESKKYEGTKVDIILPYRENTKC